MNIKFEDIILTLCCPPYLLWKNNKQNKPLSFSILLVLLYIVSSTGTEVIIYSHEKLGLDSINRVILYGY